MGSRNFNHSGGDLNRIGKGDKIMVEGIDVLKIAKQEAIAASGSLFSQTVVMDRREGFASLHLKTVGSGTIKATYQLSNDIDNDAYTAKDWVDGTTDIKTAHTAGSGVYPMPDEAFFARFLRIKLEETTTTDGVTLDAWLAVQ